MEHLEIDLIVKAQGEELGKSIQKLKAHREGPLPDVELAESMLFPLKHDVMDPLKRKDKAIIVEPDNKEIMSVTPGIEMGENNIAYERVGRIALALQKLIIKRAVAFLFGNPVVYTSEKTTDKEKEFMKVFEKILSKVKSNSLDRRIARTVFGYKECAEFWYTVEKKNKDYGFASTVQVRCALFSPENGDELYPYFDESGDMIAFSRAFVRKNAEGKEVNFFETFTPKERYIWRQDDSNWVVVDGYPKTIAIGKIPIVYAKQDEYETEDVNSLIDRLETLLSNFADTNDYHASPKIFIKGELKGFAKKGESGAIIEGEQDSDAKYLSWDNAPASVKLEIETLLNLTYTLTQTPDISFESVKGMGNISGIALKMMFMDAHLKVADKKEIFDEYFQRRASIIKAYIGEMNGGYKTLAEELDIEPEITPYMITNEIDDLEYWMTANGNEPVISHEESVDKAGLSMNVEETMKKIQSVKDKRMSFNLSEPTDM